MTGVRIPDVEQALDELEAGLPEEVGPVELALWKDTAEVLRGYAKRFTDAAATIAGMCAEAVPAGATVVSDGREFRRTGKPNRKAWQTDELLRAVRDSRIVNTSPEPIKVGDVVLQPGEVLEETPEAKILHVWNLGAPRTTALEARGISPDEFCTTEWTNRDVKEVGTDAD